MSPIVLYILTFWGASFLLLLLLLAATFVYCLVTGKSLGPWG